MIGFIQEVMFQVRRFISSLTFLLSLVNLSYAAQLPAPQNISIHSFDMRHLLRWSPLHVPCSPVTYSVIYQGEYEIHMLNGSWVDAHLCREIAQTECDLTGDLASDSDYSIRVQARCGEGTSWAWLPKTFNRKDTLLLAPDLSVILKGTRAEVKLSELRPDTTAKLKRWWDGEEQNATSVEVTTPRYSFEVPPYGRRLCLRAEVTLESINKSNSTETRCVFVPEAGPVWVKYLSVGVCVALAVGVALTLGATAPRCAPYLRKIVCHKEPLPSALLVRWPKGTPVFLARALLEPTHPVALLRPSEERGGTSEIKAFPDGVPGLLMKSPTCGEDMGSNDTRKKDRN